MVFSQNVCHAFNHNQTQTSAWLWCLKERACGFKLFCFYKWETEKCSLHLYLVPLHVSTTKDRLFGAIVSFLQLALCKPYWIERFLEHQFSRLDTNLLIHLCLEFNWANKPPLKSCVASDRLCQMVTHVMLWSPSRLTVNLICEWRLLFDFLHTLRYV